MIALRKRTRDSLRHERATVLQQLGAVADADPRAFYAANQVRAAELRRQAEHRAEPCRYCGIVGGHTADCPVIS